MFPRYFPSFRHGIDKYGEHLPQRGVCRHKYLSLLIRTICQVEYLHETGRFSVEPNISYINLSAFLKAVPCFASSGTQEVFAPLLHPPLFFVVAVVPGEGVRRSASHKCGDQMDLGAQGEKKTWAVMTAWDYYITARHEIDPLYTNKSQRRLYLKCFLIT